MSKLLATLGIIGALLLGGFALYTASNQQVADGKGGTSNANDISLSGCLTIGADNNGNGVQDCGQRKALTTATTTPCAILSPAATSTLVSLVIQIASTSAAISNLTIATSTTAFATTSLIATGSIAANAQGTYSWDPGVNNGNVSPNTFVVFGVSGGAVFNGGGTCNAVFRSVI